MHSWCSWDRWRYDQSNAWNLSCGYCDFRRYIVWIATTRLCCGRQRHVGGYPGMVRIALALLLSLLLPPAALAEKRVALVVGIDKYDNLGPQAQLRRARGDAATVAEGHWLRGDCQG